MGTGQQTYPVNLNDTDKVVSTSAGVGDAGKLIKLDAAGRLGNGLAPTTPSGNNDVASKGYVDSQISAHTPAAAGGAEIFDTTGGARTVTISSLSFTPSFVKIEAYLMDDNGSRVSSCLGSSDGTNNESIKMLYPHTESQITKSTTKAFNLADSTGAVVAYGIIDTFSSGGFRINVQAQTSSSVLGIHWTAFR